MSDTDSPWRKALLPASSSLKDALRNLDSSAMKLALCVDEAGRLVGTVTDGDLRRGLLRGLTMADPVAELVNRTPLVVPEATDPETVRRMMLANKVQQIPVVDDTARPVGLHLWDELDRVQAHEHTMVIMAGGKGTRLRPFTENCPKPMLPVAGKPMLEHIIERAKAQGFQRFVISLNYLGEMIRDHFLDGAEHGVEVSYLEETVPLGTAGALSLLSPRPQQPFIVTNGDVLTDIDYRKLIEFQSLHSADAVMAVRLFEQPNPFGVVHMDGVHIVGFEEKPVTRSHINAGIYALRPETLDLLEPDAPCDMPTLFTRLQQAARPTVAYPMHEPWLDVGRPEDLERAGQALQKDPKP